VKGREKLLSLLYILLIGIYIGMGLFIFLILNPQQATKLISKILPQLIVDQIRELFSDPEFVTATFKIPHAQLREIMKEEISVALEETKRSLREEAIKDAIDTYDHTKELITSAITTQIPEIMKEIQLPLPDNLGEYITSVLNGWMGDKMKKAGKVEGEMQQQLTQAYAEATGPAPSANPFDAMTAALSAKNPVLGMILKMAKENGGGSRSPQHSSSQSRF